jgi:hypothetical protein
VHSSAQFLLDLLELGPYPLARRFPPNLKIALRVLSAIAREPQERERFELRLAAPFPVAPSLPPKRYHLNPTQSVSGMPLNRPIDGYYKRVWYSEPDLTFGEVRLRCVGHREIYESPVIIGG